MNYHYININISNLIKKNQNCIYLETQKSSCADYFSSKNIKKIKISNI